jgi:hypothetical protein
MTFDELTPEQKIQVKQDYLVRLADKGILMQFLQGDEHEEERGPSYDELANADNLVSDDIMRKDGVDYVEGDFGPDGYDVRDCDKILRWALKYITLDNMTEDSGTFLLDEASMSAARMALDWAREAVARKCSELVME